MTHSYPSETEQLKLANHYLRVALDQTQEGVIMLDTGPLDGSGPRVLYSNVPVACLVGIEPSKGLRGLHLKDLVKTERDVVALLGALNDAATAGAAQCLAGIQTFYNGGSKQCLWRVKALHNSMKRLLNFTITVKEVPAEQPTQTSLHSPFSEVQPLAAQLPVTKKAEDLDRVSDRLRVENLAALAQGIAHDVNNLLGPITAQLSLVLPSMDPDTELGQTLDRVLNAARRAKSYTSQIVRMAKGRPMENKPTDLKDVIRDTVTLSKAGSNVEVALAVAEDLHKAKCDPIKIGQVLQNLVLNGIQAMPSGGFMAVEARNVLIGQNQDTKLAAGHYLEIIVRDRGTGISPENMQKLFKDNFTTKEDGNGIGLTTCMLFIEQHEGDIRVTSEVNVGTEFKIFLPAAVETATAVDSPTITAAPVAKPVLRAGQGNVLIVDDDKTIRFVACSILRRCGYTVTECDNGELAVKHYQQAERSGTPYDVVLMDLTLRGGMEGLEASQEIWAQYPTARIVVSSGSVTDEVQKSFVEQGFFCILPKPYEAADLSEVVHKATSIPKSTLA
jgi:signal transduction histidine kinase/ActR/RegA family two-component response regulator